MSKKVMGRMENKEKNQQISAAQQEKLKARTAQAQELEALKKQSPEQLREALTNKNKDYVFRLEKFLQSDGDDVTEEKAHEMVNALLVDMIVSQRKGVPAAALYDASPQIQAQRLLHPKKAVSKIKFWMRATDNGLLYLAIFTGVLGIVALFSNQKTQNNTQMGIVTVFSVGLLFGIFMTYYNDMIMEKNDKKKGPNFWKLLLWGVAIVAGMFFWIVLTSLPALRALNPVIPGWAELLIAIVAYLYRRFFRAHYGITDAMQLDGQRRARRYK